MIGKITTPGVRKIPMITPRPPSQFGYATNQKMYCSTPATSVIDTPTGRNEFLKRFTSETLLAFALAWIPNKNVSDSYKRWIIIKFC